MTILETEKLLQDIIRHQARSLLQYAGESSPYLTPDDQAAWAKVQALVKEERDGAATVARYMVGKHMRPPYLGAYPINFTDINFLRLDHLLPMLVKYQKKRGADLEKLHAELYDNPVLPVVGNVLDLNRRILKALVDLIPNANGEVVPAPPSPG